MRGYPDEISERLNEEAVRVERIREQVPEGEFDETTAKGIAHQEIAPYCDNGK